jgi:hypothetical protein
VTSPSTATLRSRYVEQAASDLKEVRRQQHELAERIKVLQQEEALLVEILSLVERIPAQEAPSLPEQARDEPTAGSAGSSAGASAPDREAAGRATGTAASPGSTPADRAKRSPQQPLLGDLLRQLLSSHEEPRLARELRDELLERHPDRTPTPQVVRNTLEGLVAKGAVRRHRQQRSVMYSLVQSAQRASPKG